MTINTGGHFQTSEIKKMVNPDPNISKSIAELENHLIGLPLYDEVKEIFGSPYSEIVYKKDGEEVFVIGLNKSNYFLKLSGYKWDLVPFLQFPIEREFSIEKTFYWRLSDLEKVEPLELVKAIKESRDYPKDLEQLMRFLLIVISAYVCKASFLNESEKELKYIVLEHFWKGEINVISDLYEKNIHSRGVHFNEFIKKWKDQLNCKFEIDETHFSNEMDLDRSQLKNLFKTIQAYFDQSINKYIHSISNLWFEEDLMQDELNFYEKVKQIRSRILLAQEYLHDMQSLISEEALDLQLQSETNIESNDPLSEFFYKNGESSKLFFSKEDLFPANPTLVINENILERLAGSISNGRKFKKEYSNLIRIIFNKSLTKGFTVKEIVRTFFNGKYDDDSERKDFEQRYDVKRLFIKTTLENVFETIMKNLIELNIIKKELTIIQAKQQEKITFNYNIKIYDTY